MELENEAFCFAFFSGYSNRQSIQVAIVLLSIILSFFFIICRVLFASSVLNLCELVALRPDLGTSFKVYYFHENQLVYPVRKQQDRDFQHGYSQILSWYIGIFQLLYISEFLIMFCQAWLLIKCCSILTTTWTPSSILSRCS